MDLAIGVCVGVLLGATWAWTAATATGRSRLEREHERVSDLRVELAEMTVRWQAAQREVHRVEALVDAAAAEPHPRASDRELVHDVGRMMIELVHGPAAAADIDDEDDDGLAFDPIPEPEIAFDIDDYDEIDGWKNLPVVDEPVELEIEVE